MIYAKNISVDPFVEVDDIKIFRKKLVAAAQVTNKLFNARKKAILQTAANESGSPITYHAEDLEAAQTFLKKLDRTETLLPQGYRYEPKGNTLVILSANEPIITATTVIFSSLYMGNTVYIKPSSKTPSFSRLLIGELKKIPVLKKRIHYALIDAQEIERLIKKGAFDFVLSFGSGSTNKQLGMLCAAHNVEFLPESEGNDWAYIDKKCSGVKKISAIIAQAFTRHNGQMCNAVRGVLVHASLFDAFLEQLKRDVSQLPVGNATHATTRIGALLSGTSEYTASFVRKVSPFAKQVWNFSAHGDCITPTIIVEPDDSSPLLHIGLFAPVLWVKKVTNHKEAISLYHKRNRHGLCFSIFSDDKKVVSELADKIKAARININKSPLDVDVLEPWGGIRLSGYGGPSHFVEKVANKKYVTMKKF